MDAKPISEAEAEALRAQFPAFTRSVNGTPLAYLDSASTTQKPRAVIEAVTRANEASANIHRGVHALSVETTAAFEATRGKAAALLGVRDPQEIIFVRGVTEGLNLVAQSWGRANVRAGDEILVSELEHHSNLVPWQQLCREKQAVLRVLPIDERGNVRLERLGDLLSSRTRLVAIAHVSNSLGTVLPVAEIARRARAVGAITVVDGAQAVAHLPVDVAELGCDVYVFSGHKMYAPTGSGVLWGKRALLEAMPPWQTGGDMVASVSFTETTFAEIPQRFEAGTPDITAVIGLGVAIDWLREIGLARIAARDAELLDYATRVLAEIPAVRCIGTSNHKSGIVSFVVGDLHAHDVGSLLDLEGIAARAGHHCAQPVMDHFGIDGAVRASFGIYTTKKDVDRLGVALRKACHVLGAS